MLELVSGTDRDELGEAAAAYGAELRRWRERRGLSKPDLARSMAYDRSYVIHIEALRCPPTERFTRQAEAALDCGGALWARWEAWREARWGDTPPLAARPPAPLAWQAVIDELAALRKQVAALTTALAAPPPRAEVTPTDHR